MATYYTNPNNQRDTTVTPMFYARENMPGSYPETPNSMMMYMNSGSFPDPQQQPNNSEVLAMEGQDHAPPQQEILSILGGSRIGEHEYNNAWRDGRNEMLLMQSVGASTGMLEGQGTLQGQGLSLSLSTRIPSGIQIPFPYRSHNQDFGSLLSPNASVSGGNQDLQKGDLSPYTMPGAARNIPGSKYLKAAQELLDEVVNVRKALKQSDAEKNKNEELEKSSKEGDGGSKNDCLNPQESTSSTSELSHAERQDLQNKLTKLLSMLDEVDRRYKQYYHQMQIVVSSFDAIAGCGAAKPYTALALQTISRHFRCLRDAITGQIRAARKSLGEQDSSGNGKGVGISRLRFVDQQLRQQRALQQLGMMQQHAWRPQRGLPESSVSILRAWLFEHFLHPYPKDSDKIMLARQTGLTRSQVSNWFINARVRLWKPMVEEMYKEEAGDAEMESNSSSDNAGKGTTRADTVTSEGRGEDNHQTLTGPEIEMAGSSSFHNRPGQDAEGEYGLLRPRAEERPSLDDCSLFPDHHSMVHSAYQMPEMGGGVSLTLGLQHCDGANLPPAMTHHGFVAMRGDDVYNTGAPESSDFECIDGGNRQHRFSSSQMLHDFVA